MRRAAAVLAVFFLSCRACIAGSVNECSADSDCKGRGTVPVCQDHLCVDDPRCSTAGSTDSNAVVFGMVLPLTDSAGMPGPGWGQNVDTIKLVLDELNPPKRQGLGGRPVRAIICDEHESPTAATELATVLISEGVALVLTDGSSDVVNIAGVAVPAGVLTLSASSFSPEITTLAASPHGVRLVWRTTASDAVVMRALAQQLASDAGMPIVAAFARDDAYGQADLAAFRAAYPGTVEPYIFQPGATDVASVLAAAAAMGPKPQMKTLFGFQVDHTELLNAAEAPAYVSIVGAPWFFTQGARFPTLLSSLTNPARVTGSYGVWTLQHIDSVAYQWLQTNLRARDGTDPSTVQYLPNIADAVMLACIATAAVVTTKQPLDGDHIAGMLAHIGVTDGGAIPLDPPDFNTAVSQLVSGAHIDVEGASGHLDFDPLTGEAAADVEIWQVTDAGFSSIAVLPQQ